MMICVTNIQMDAMISSLRRPSLSTKAMAPKVAATFTAHHHSKSSRMPQPFLQAEAAHSSTFCPMEDSRGSYRMAALAIQTIQGRKGCASGEIVLMPPGKDLRVRWVDMWEGDSPTSTTTVLSRLPVAPPAICSKRTGA